MVRMEGGSLASSSLLLGQPHCTPSPFSPPMSGLTEWQGLGMERVPEEWCHS